MGERGFCFCPVEGIINIISKKWALVIIGTISNYDKLRFNELLNNLNGISPKMLSNRLKELNEAGLIRRNVFPEIPPKVEYSLTQDGIEVRDAMIPLMEWAHNNTLKNVD
ncbi:MAG: winged helix-turn-helix transcriptional regulator [Promethearchaeota archaeon]|jgi:DNA-binding HxlR family transcriptional regulator